MVVPDDIAQQLYDLELVVIQLSHDPRLPPLDQEPKLLFEVDRLSTATPPGLAPSSTSIMAGPDAVMIPTAPSARAA